MGAMDGIWRSEAGEYTVATCGSRIYWLGVGKFRDAHGEGKTWAHVFCGNLRGSVVSGIWGDLPLGQDHMHGTLELLIDGGGMTMTRTAQTGGFGCQRWARLPSVRADGAFFDAMPGYWGDELFTGVYDNDEVEHGAGAGVYWLSQWDNHVFWFGKSKGAGQYANVGFGTVRGHLIEVEWCDLPLGNDKFSGQRLTLEFNEPEETLTKVGDDSGIFGGKVWRKRPLQSEFAQASRWIQTSERQLRTSPGDRLLQSLSATSTPENDAADLSDLLHQYKLTSAFEIKSSTIGESRGYVYLYTLQCPFFLHLNRNLRQDTVVLPKWVGYIRRLTAALEGLPSYQGFGYRGVCLDTDQVQQYTAGATFLWAGFTSVSKQRAIAEKFAQKSADGFVFEIFIREQGLGYEVRRTSAYPDEDEVLLAPNTVFVVRGCDERVIRLEVLSEETRASRKQLLNTLNEEGSGALVIGLTGATRSGKSRLAEMLRARLVERGHTVELVGQDAFWVKCVEVALSDGSVVQSEEETSCTDHEAFVAAIKEARTRVGGNGATRRGVVLTEGFQLLHASEVQHMIEHIFYLDIDRTESRRRRCSPAGPHNPNPLPTWKFDQLAWPAHERYVGSSVQPLGSRVHRLGPITDQDQDYSDAVEAVLRHISTHD